MKQLHLFLLAVFSFFLAACVTPTRMQVPTSTPTTPAPSSVPSLTPTVVPSATRIPATPTLTATPFPTRPFILAAFHFSERDSREALKIGHNLYDHSEFSIAVSI